MFIILVLCFHSPLAASASSKCTKISNPLVLLVGVSEYNHLRSLPGVQEEMYHLYQLFGVEYKYHVRCTFDYDEAYAKKYKKVPKMLLTFKALTDFLDSSYKIYQKVEEYDALIFVFSGHGCMSNHAQPMVLLSDSKLLDSSTKLINVEYFEHIKNKFCGIANNNAKKNFIDKPKIFFNLSCQSNDQNVEYPLYQPPQPKEVPKISIELKRYRLKEKKLLKSVITISSTLKGLATGTRLGVNITKLFREATRNQKKSLHGIVDYIHKNIGNSSCMLNIQPSFGADKIFFVKSSVMFIENLGNVLRDLGLYKEARIYYEKVLKIREQDCGPKHLNTASTMVNLGNVLRSLGDCTSAKKYYERALKIHEYHYGATNIVTGLTMEFLGNVLDDLGEYALAKEYYEKALKTQEQHYGPTDIRTAITRENLATVFHKLEKYEKASVCYQQNIELFTQHYHEDHPETKRAKRMLASLNQQPSMCIVM